MTMNKQNNRRVGRHTHPLTTALLTAVIGAFGIATGASANGSDAQLDVAQMGSSLGRHAMQLVCMTTTTKHESEFNKLNQLEQ